MGKIIEEDKWCNLYTIFYTLLNEVPRRTSHLRYYFFENRKGKFITNVACHWHIWIIRIDITCQYKFV